MEIELKMIFENKWLYHDTKLKSKSKLTFRGAKVEVPFISRFFVARSFSVGPDISLSED